MAVNNLLREVKRRIKPSHEEEMQILRLAKAIMGKIKIPGVNIAIGGSFAKGTWMKTTKEVDLYARFNYQRYRGESGELADILERALKKHFTVSRLHGSRDYFQVKKDEYTFEIVPILAITRAEQAKNITDFSSFHVSYVRKRGNLADEIRLAKAFAKAQGVYGAESYIRGFSGYVLELLVIRHGSFLKLAKSAALWQPKVIIGDGRRAEKLSWAKRVSPIIFIDPVQPDRNAAAALSDEKFWTFVGACRKFLANPSEEFFVRRPVDVSALRRMGKVVIVSCIPLRGKIDVIGAKALKAVEFIKAELIRHEFALKFFHFEFDKLARSYLVVDRELLSEYTVALGPPVRMKRHFEEFTKKHQNYELEDGRAVAHVKREFRSIEQIMRVLVKNVDVTSRVKSATYEILEQKGSKEAA